jgi:hypothetical protein
MKSRRKSRVAKRRARNAKGHFVARARASAKAKSPARRRARAAAPASTSRRRVRARARARAKTPVAAPRRVRAKARARARDWPQDHAGHVRAGKLGARRRKRARAASPRASARDWSGHRAGHRKAARKGWRKKRYCAPRVSEAAPRRRSRKRRASARDWSGQPGRHSKAAKLGWSRRRRAKTVRRRASSRRYHAKPRRKSSARRSGYRYGGRKYTKRTSRSHRLPAHHREIRPEDYGPSGAFDGGYVLSNPLSGGELVLVGITGILGYGLADFAGRYMMTTPVAAGASTNAIPPNVTYSNDVATSAFPSWQAMATQAGIAAVPGIAAAFVDSPWGRAALQGMMLGAGFALFGGIFKGLMAQMLGSSALGQQLYAAEIEAQMAVTAGGNFCQAGAAAVQSNPAQIQAAPSATTPAAPVGQSGLPRGVGARPMLRRPMDVGPHARGIGQVAPGQIAPPAVAPPTATMMPVPVANSPLPPPVAPLPNTSVPVVSIPAPIAQGGQSRSKNASGRGGCGDEWSPVPQPGLSHPASAFQGGVLSSTGDVVQMPPAGTPTPGGPSSGPMCGGPGALAQTQDLAERTIRDESCLGKVPGGVLFGSFPVEADG